MLKWFSMTYSVSRSAECHALYKERIRHSLSVLLLRQQCLPLQIHHHQRPLAGNLFLLSSLVHSVLYGPYNRFLDFTFTVQSLVYAEKKNAMIVLWFLSFLGGRSASWKASSKISRRAQWRLLTRSPQREEVSKNLFILYSQQASQAYRRLKKSLFLFTSEKEREREVISISEKQTSK